MGVEGHAGGGLQEVKLKKKLSALHNYRIYFINGEGISVIKSKNFYQYHNEKLQPIRLNDLILHTALDCILAKQLN